VSDFSSTGTRDDIAGGSSGWAGPNERTASVDAALVRILRALDATAAHHEGHRPRRIELVVEGEGQSVLEFVIGNDGRWSFDEGSWVDEGRSHRSRLLRPVIRGVARATRPEFRSALDTLVRDVELACAAYIAADSEHDPATVPAAGQTVDELLEAAFPALSPADRAALRSVTSPVDLGAGSTLLVEGSAGDEVVFLLGGRVAVETRGGTVRLGPGSVVGERSPLTGKPRDATVRAITDVALLVLHARDLEGLPAAVSEALSAKIRV
jgi:hypothetical protein